jgi:hypothetical protein
MKQTHLHRVETQQEQSHKTKPQQAHQHERARERGSNLVNRTSIL